jgi:hypothetical protein
MKAKKQGSEEVVCISKAKYEAIRSALKIGLEAMKFGGFFKRTRQQKTLANIEAFVATV